MSSIDNYWEDAPHEREPEVHDPQLADEGWDPTGRFELECPTCAHQLADGSRGIPGRIPDRSSPLGWRPCPDCGTNGTPEIQLDGPVRGGDGVYPGKTIEPWVLPDSRFQEPRQGRFYAGPGRSSGDWTESGSNGLQAPRTARPADPEWWDDRNAGKPLYHATDGDRLQHIMQHGLHPWDAEENLGGPQYGNEFEVDPAEDWLRPRPGHVYMTENLGRAEQYTKDRHNPIVLRIDPSHLDPRNINPDEDSLNGLQHQWQDHNPDLARSMGYEPSTNTVGQPIWGYRDDWDGEDEQDGPDPEFKSLGDVVQERGYGDDPAHTQRGVEGTGTLAYRGFIHPRAITPLYRHPQTGQWLPMEYTPGPAGEEWKGSYGNPQVQTLSHVPEEHRHRELGMSAIDYLEDNRYRKRVTSVWDEV